MNQESVEVSIIVPVKDERESIESLAAEVTSVMNRHPWSWECLWVDDGSTDGSLQIIQRLCASDPHHRYLAFQCNTGQSAAFCAGFREARGYVLATMDGDGQNDPADIPGLVKLVLSGKTDMANGYRAKRHDTWLRKLASRIANGFRNKVTGKTVRDVGCSTRAFRRECTASLPQFRGMHRFLPTLVSMQGFTLGELPVNHRPRIRGRSKYTINNRLWVGLLDTFGILWLRKRGFTYRISHRSESGQ